MALTSYERGSTFKTSVEWMSGSTYVDPRDEVSYIDIYRSDGEKLRDTDAGIKDSTGKYHFYVETADTDPLGIYIIDWYGEFDYGGSFNYMPLHNKECVIIEKVVQT